MERRDRCGSELRIVDVVRNPLETAVVGLPHLLIQGLEEHLVRFRVVDGRVVMAGS